MNIKKRIKLLSATILANLTCFSISVSADTQVQDVIDERYSSAQYVLGYSLDDSQIEQVFSYFGDSNTTYSTMTLDEYNDIFGTSVNVQLYSSVKIESAESGSGITVTILTPENITRVTENMYRNAVITAGIEDANIYVASPVVVTGESALAGVYYSIEENGATVSAERLELANEELTILSDINKEKEDDSDYDEAKLNVALMDMKAAVSELQDNQLTEKQVETIVDNALTQYQLSLTESQNQEFINYLIKLGGSSVSDDSSFLTTLESTKNSIIQNAGNIFSDIDVNLDLSSLTNTSFWQGISQWFDDLWSNLANLIGGNKDTSSESSEVVSSSSNEGGNSASTGDVESRDKAAE